MEGVNNVARACKKSPKAIQRTKDISKKVAAIVIISATAIYACVASLRLKQRQWTQTLGRRHETLFGKCGRRKMSWVVPSAFFKLPSMLGDVACLPTCALTVGRANDSTTESHTI